MAYDIVQGLNICCLVVSMPMAQSSQRRCTVRVELWPVRSRLQAQWRNFHWCSCGWGFSWVWNATAVPCDQAVGTSWGRGGRWRSCSIWVELFPFTLWPFSVGRCLSGRCDTGCGYAPSERFRARWRHHRQPCALSPSKLPTSSHLHCWTVTFGLHHFHALEGPSLPLPLVYGSQFVEDCLGLRGGPVDAMFPGLDFLALVGFGVDFDAVGAEGLEAVGLHAEIGDLFPGVLVALQARAVCALHNETIYIQTYHLIINPPIPLLPVPQLAMFACAWRCWCFDFVVW